MLALSSERQYTSESAFVPLTREMPSNLGSLAGLAADFGVALPQGSAWDTPEFYSKLLENPQILAKAGLASFGELTEGKTLAEYYEVDDERRPAMTELQIVRRLDEDIDAQVDAKTGVVSMSVRAPSAALAQALNRRMIALIAEFNQSTQQSRARSEREFYERRLGEAKDSLRGAEDRLQAFLQRNRAVANSAELTFQQERLTRELTLQQALYNSIAQSYETAKIDEVRDVPVLAPVLLPTLPPRGDSKGSVPNAILGALLGSLLALLLAVVREGRQALEQQRTGELGELRELIGATSADLRALWRRIWRLGRREPTGP